MLYGFCLSLTCIICIDLSIKATHTLAVSKQILLTEITIFYLNDIPVCDNISMHYLSNDHTLLVVECNSFSQCRSMFHPCVWSLMDHGICWKQVILPIYTANFYLYLCDNMREVRKLWNLTPAPFRNLATSKNAISSKKSCDSNMKHGRKKNGQLVLIYQKNG